jgi:3-hydroxy-9,10-secoandrosta-1,3,5(10)-triene-9,17-dione monooxygenase reductase component
MSMVTPMILMSHSEEQTFRAALGHFCSGVTVITTIKEDGAPAGFACQAFSALSLKPPLILFCPSRNSRTWPVIESAGHFCVNILSHSQRGISKIFSEFEGDRFARVAWSAAPSGSPVLNQALTWFDCSVHAVHDGGDHFVVIGEVRCLGDAKSRPGRPLLFYRGAYTVTEDRKPPRRRARRGRGNHRNA